MKIYLHKTSGEKRTVKKEGEDRFFDNRDPDDWLLVYSKQEKEDTCSK